MKTIRANLTFTFDEARVSERDIKNRLELILVDEFSDDVEDVHTGWV